ncbi:MAG TPA: SGNH/GDSL hydrolase family protein, partial [Polyangia bacterium]
GRGGQAGGAGGGGRGGGVGGGGRGGQAGGPGAGGAAGGGAGNGGAGGSTASYNPCPTNGDPCKVLPLGDSITFGINYEGSYRVELFKKAVTASQNITFVGTQSNGPAMAPGTTVPFPPHHEGHSGFTIAQIQAVVPMDVTYAPHMVLLHAGTNDTYMSDPAGAPARLSSFVDYLTTTFPNALIVVAKIIPYPSETANVNLINQSIPTMVASKVSAGKHVTMVDLNTGFQTSTMLSSDGIHPNQTGYNWMGDTWYAAVGSLFN